MDALVGEIEGYKCPRCTKSFGYVWHDNKGYTFFCGQDYCLKDDSDESKAKLRNKKTVVHESKRQDASEVFRLGNRYFNANLAKWSAHPEHHKAISNWIKNPQNMLIMLGTPGTGKTYFSMAVSNYFMENEQNVYYTNSRRFLQDIQNGIGQSKSQYETIQQIASYDILILDDLGASTNNEWQKEVFLDLIDQRYSQQKPTIITSNISFENMKNVLGERIERRLNNDDNLRITIG